MPSSRFRRPARRPETPEATYEAALRFLSARPRSIAEVRRRLASNGHPDNQVDETIAKLCRVGLLDDRGFADYWVNQRQSFSPRGARALLFELRGRGVDERIAAPAVEPARADEEESAFRVARMRVGRLRAGIDRETFTRAITGHLLRRGFGFGTALGAARRLWSESSGSIE